MAQPLPKPKSPRCIVIAGPNGSGKTTFAKQFLSLEGMPRFVNADLIASGLSGLKPELAAIAAGRVFLGELDRIAGDLEDFAFETTFSGRAYLPRLSAWKAAGYHLQIVYLQLVSAEVAIGRVRARVKQGGHWLPPGDVRRRYTRSWENFMSFYRPLADAWAVYDNSGDRPILVEASQ